MLFHPSLPGVTAAHLCVTAAAGDPAGVVAISLVFREPERAQAAHDMLAERIRADDFDFSDLRFVEPAPAFETRSKVFVTWHDPDVGQVDVPAVVVGVEDDDRRRVRSDGGVVSVVHIRDLKARGA